MDNTRNPHSKIITLINDDYAKMLVKQAEQRKISISASVSTEASSQQLNEGKVNFGKKLRNLVKRPSGNKAESVFIHVNSAKKSTNNGLSTISETDSLSFRNRKSFILQPQHPSSAVAVSVSSTLHNKTPKTWFGNKMEEILWWEPPSDSLPLDFCRDTSLHGLKYIGQKERHLSERIFWLAAFILGLSLAAVLINDVWRKYSNSPIIVSFQSSETTVPEIPFPAITVCNMNKVLKSKANEYLANFAQRKPDSYKQVYYLDHVCSATKTFTRRFNFTNDLANTLKNSIAEEHGNVTELTQVNEFLREASQNCSDMIPLCIWQDEVYNCSLLFRPIETEFGKCCTFNMVPQSVLYTLRNDNRDNQTEIDEWHKWDILKYGLVLKDYKHVFPRRQMQAGKSFGLSFLLNPSLDEYYCTTSDSKGFRLTTHLPIETPHNTDFGISIRPNAEVFVNVKPEISVVDSTIFKFDKNTRQCYTFGEFPLKYFKYYTTSNCIDECIANRTFKECGCKRYYMPRDENQTLCGGKQTNFECAESIKLNISKSGAKKECAMCLESCNEIEYQSQTTTTPLQERIWQNENPNIQTWKDDTISIVHVFLGQPSTYARVRKELYGSTDLFANTGGLMGLCLGFSGLSLMELLYFITLRAYWVSQRKQKIQQSVVERFKKVWTKVLALRFLGGQRELEKQVNEKEIEKNVLSSSPLQLPPGYATIDRTNIRHINELPETDASNVTTSDGEKLIKIGSASKRQIMSAVDYKSILGNIK